jgi:hypothetical protein
MLASYGFIVFGICHQDKSCLHTIDREGKDIYHGPRTYDIEADFKERERQLRVREQEMIELINEVLNTDMLQ